MSSFTKNEVYELIISWVVLTVAFGFAFSGSVFSFIDFNNLVWSFIYLLPKYFIIIIYSLPKYFIVVGASFLLHELSHKFTEIRYGYFAQFHMWQTALLLALLMAVTVGFVFAAPGAVYIYGINDEKKDAKISLSGPFANIAVAVVSLISYRISFIPLLAQVAYISAFIGVFNLLPFGPLDGNKIFRHEKIWWVLLIAIGAIIIFTI
jgi:Zn-dependent protease